MSLVETDWLAKNLKNVKILDCSWHMPQTNRNGFEEYKDRHIPNAIFFDLDDNSKKDISLPHMLVEINEWEKIVSKMGIQKNDKIIKIRDITQDTVGLLILNSVINIYLFMGFIFPRGLTFFSPSATIMSPSVNPEIISIFLSVLNPVFTWILFAIFSSLIL